MVTKFYYRAGQKKKKKEKVTIYVEFSGYLGEEGGSIWSSLLFFNKHSL